MSLQSTLAGSETQSRPPWLHSSLETNLGYNCLPHPTTILKMTKYIDYFVKFTGVPKTVQAVALFLGGDTKTI